MDKDELEKINNFTNTEMVQYLEHYCYVGNFEAVKYMLTSPNIKNPLNLYICGDNAIFQACKNGHLNIVQYLTSSPELSNHVAYSDKIDKGFIGACEKWHLDVIKYLIFDYKIEFSSEIYEYLGDSLMNDEIEEMFYVRSLHDDIDKDLSINTKDKVVKKIKI
jgi:ankyrin repeat protein